MGGRLSLQMDKASEPCTNSPPNLTSTPKNEEIFLGRELAEEGRAEVRKCGSAGGGGRGATKLSAHRVVQTVFPARKS